MIKWDAVLKTHHSWRGGADRGGKVASLLCNQHKDAEHGDAIFADRIEYVKPNNSLIAERRALQEMVETGNTLHVFEKPGVNSWKPHGEWVVANMAKEEVVTLFELPRSSATNA